MKNYLRYAKMATFNYWARAEKKLKLSNLIKLKNCLFFNKLWTHFQFFSESSSIFVPAEKQKPALLMKNFMMSGQNMKRQQKCGRQKREKWDDLGTFDILRPL